MKTLNTFLGGSLLTVISVSTTVLAASGPSTQCMDKLLPSVGYDMTKAAEVCRGDR